MLIKQWHKILFLAIGIATTLAAALSAVMFPSFADRLVQMSKPKAGSGQPVVALDDRALEAQEALWLQPKLWEIANAKPHDLFVGRKFYYFPSRDAVSLVEGDLDVFGLPYSFVERYQLPINDPLIGRRDLDGDGFSNRMEFAANTLPNDPNSHPPYSELLRLKSFSTKRYRMRFQTKSELGGQEVYQVATPDGSKRVSFLKQGEEIDGFRVEAFVAKTKEPEPPDFVSDVSELQLRNLKTGQTVALVIGREQDVPEITTEFVLLVPGLSESPVTVKIGETFTLNVPRPAGIAPVVVQYRLLSSSAQEAVVEDVARKVQVKIPLVQPQDQELIPLPDIGSPAA